jgi:tRNA pseudouridine65 synthase
MILDILYQDDYLVAIDKPSGLFVHPTDLDRTALTCLPILRDQLGKWVYPAHRLDRGTSGVVLFALSPEGAGALSAQFENRGVLKEYLAIVRGFSPESGTIDHAYRPPDSDEPVEAVTAFVREATAELPFAVGPYQTARYSLIKAMPQTGRQHQIRKHCAHMNHPVVGDHDYGDGRHNRFFREHFGLHRLLLMATRIQFRHPETGETLSVEAPVPSRVARVCAQVGWEEVVHRYGLGKQGPVKARSAAKYTDSGCEDEAPLMGVVP